MSPPSPRRLAAQYALVRALKGCVEAAMIDGDEHAAELAHEDLMRAEARLLRMEGRLTGRPAPVAAARIPDDFEVIEA